MAADGRMFNHRGGPKGHLRRRLGTGPNFAMDRSSHEMPRTSFTAGGPSNGGLPVDPPEAADGRLRRFMQKKWMLN
jgi:hypothetical protein